MWWAVRPLQHSTPSQKLRVACVRLTKCRLAWRTRRELANSENKKTNAISLVTSSDSCPADAEQLCLTFSSVVDRARFEKLYKQIDLATDNFSKLVNEEVENNAATDKAPSTHTSTVVPVTTEGTKPDLNASFVSANAEQFYQYQPRNHSFRRPTVG